MRHGQFIGALRDIDANARHHGISPALTQDARDLAQRSPARQGVVLRLDHHVVWPLEVRVDVLGTQGAHRCEPNGERDESPAIARQHGPEYITDGECGASRRQPIAACAATPSGLMVGNKCAQVRPCMGVHVNGLQQLRIGGKGGPRHRQRIERRVTAHKGGKTLRCERPARILNVHATRLEHRLNEVPRRGDAALQQRGHGGRGAVADCLAGLLRGASGARNMREALALRKGVLRQRVTDHRHL